MSDPTKNADRFIEKLYDLTNGVVGEEKSKYLVGSHLGLPAAETDTIVPYVVGLGFVHYRQPSGQEHLVSLLAPGVKHVSELRARREKGSIGFKP